MTLVLAGGGPAAIAWELGVLRGLADADAELAQKVIGAGTVIGTSGGSSVAAQITSAHRWTNCMTRSFPPAPPKSRSSST
jgi:predicted acylesterase/phospholipase RssA